MKKYQAILKHIDETHGYRLDIQAESSAEALTSAIESARASDSGSYFVEIITCEAIVVWDECNGFW